MSKPPLVIGLGAAIFLIQAILVGVSVPTMLAASFIVVLMLLLLVGIKNTQASQSDRATHSIERRILPRLRAQLASSSSFSHKALLQLADKIDLLSSVCQGASANHAAKEQIENLLKDILVILQFGDRLHQQQKGTIESIDLIEQALKEMHKQGWSEQELVESLDQIEQKTRMEQHKSPQDEGKVTYF